MIWIVVERCVMEEKNKGRKRIVGLRLTAVEFAELEKSWKQSTVRKLSEYVRRVLFGRTLTVYTRNKSVDDLAGEMVVLRHELNKIGVNFNQAVHRLNMLDHSPQMEAWILRFERDKERFFGTVESIQSRLKLIGSAWLQ